MLTVAACCTALAHAAPVQVQVGPTRLLSTSFGYSVAYREVQHGDTATISIGLFLYDRGRWIRSPLRLGKDISGIDDVAFSDRLHGWVAAYDCARATVFLYRTSDGGRSWRSLGGPATHSCGGGPTYLSFVDRTRGWMEPVSPNGPAGELLGTADGGSTWTLRSALHDRLPALPCLAPIEFLTRSLGWMARCGGDVFVTHDAGRRWRRISIGRGRAFYDVPRFAGRHGVIAATRGAATSTSVTFLVTNDGGATWARHATRPLASCPLPLDGSPFVAVWPAAEASASVWWVVSGGRAQVTADAGRHWHAASTRGLPSRAVVRTGGTNSALFETRDGGRDWQRVELLR